MKSFRIVYSLLSIISINLILLETTTSTSFLAKSHFKKQLSFNATPVPSRNLSSTNTIHPRILNEENDKFVANVDKMTDAYKQMDNLIGKIREQMMDVKHNYFSEFSGLVNELDSDGGGSVLDQMINEHYQKQMQGDRILI